MFLEVALFVHAKEQTNGVQIEHRDAGPNGEPLAFVGNVLIPPFAKLPDVLVWGNRTFIYEETLEGGKPYYIEGVSWRVRGRQAAATVVTTKK